MSCLLQSVTHCFRLLVIFCRYNFIFGYQLTNSWIGDGGHVLMAEFKFHETSFCVGYLYALNRNSNRDEFFASCASSVDPSIPTVLCGDFNAVFNRLLDRRGSNVFDSSRESCSTLSSFFIDCCVADIWRIPHPSLFLPFCGLSLMALLPPALICLAVPGCTMLYLVNYFLVLFRIIQPCCWSVPSLSLFPMDKGGGSLKLVF